MLKCTIAGGRTEGANERSLFSPPTWRWWRQVTTTYDCKMLSYWYRSIRPSASQRCIESASLRPGTHLFFFGRTEFRTNCPIGRRQKFECLWKLQTPGKPCEQHIPQRNWTFPFLTMEKWWSSSNFNVSCCFWLFVVEWFHFVNDYVQLEELVWISTCCVTLSELFFRRDDRSISRSISGSSVCCMLSMQISSIGLFIVSEMTENPTAQCMKLLFCATLLILGSFSNDDGNGNGNENVVIKCEFSLL